MTNEELAAKLTDILVQLEARSAELQAKFDNPGGPPEENFNRKQQINQIKGMLDHRITHLTTQRDNYAAASQIAVAALSDADRQALEDALTALSGSIAATQDFQNFLALAGQIAAAADSAHTAAGA